jgi:hypothetical protein
MGATTSRDAGFTLVEFVLSAGILVILLGAAFQLNVMLQRRLGPAQLMAQSHANADFALNRAADILRGAGANPSNSSVFNSLAYLENPDATSVRIRSDYNGDGDVLDRLGTVERNPDFYYVTSEDITLRWFRDETEVDGVTIPAFSLAMIDNTPDSSGTASAGPIVIASCIRNFSCTPVGNPVREATLLVVAGPTQTIPQIDPTAMEFTRSLRIPLRNFP